MQSVRSKILERKLGFLQRVLSAGSRCVSGRLVESMSDSIDYIIYGDSISSLCLVRPRGSVRNCVVWCGFH